MYTKKMLSTAAAVAVLSTGLMAFDSTPSGEIITGTQNASYLNGTVGAAALNLSADQRGDALIYPFYRMSDGWESEIIVRNTSQHATVAKVVLYAQRDSEELVDFNIYLSPYDVFRFTVKDGVITTTDGSVPMQVTSPHYGVAADDPDFNPHDGAEFELLKFEADKIAAGAKGYAIIYGMTQYNDGDTLLSDATELNYHKDASGKTLHKSLWHDYRRLLDDCRPGWRGAYTSNGTIAGMIDGMMTVAVAAPNTPANCGSNDGNGTPTNAASNSIVSGYDLANFGDVAPNTLIGTVRVSNATAGVERDLLLPATALQNMTDENMLLWSAGEYAAIQDRRIEDGAYEETGIRADALTFLTTSAYYTYNANDISNKMLVTQPMKRVLVQLGNDDGYWQNFTPANQWGGFLINYNLLDEDERSDSETINITKGNITSPFNSSPDDAVITYDDELVELADLEDSAAQDYFKTTNGFAYINFEGSAKGLPAVVTQMVGSKVGATYHTNWVYAPTIK